MGVAVDLRVLELLCARVAHDLINPVGAVANGLEELEEGDASMDDDALRLCRDSLQRATILLQIFRSAYGTAGSLPSFTPQAARDLAAAFLAGGQWTLDWPAGDLPGRPGLGKLGLNLVLLASGALPRGGRIAVGLDHGPAGVTLTVTAAGAGAQVNGETRLALAPDADSETLSTRSVLAHVAALLAERLGGRIAATPVGVDRVDFAVTLPPG